MELRSTKDDIDVVLDIAKRYGVKVFLHSSFPHASMHSGLAKQPDSCNTRGLTKKDTSARASGGPTAHHCDPSQRTVWFQHLDIAGVETHLHEICHVIMSPPGHDIDQLSEDVVLMPFERVLARQCLSPKSYKLVLRWQLNTQIEWWNAKLKKYYGLLEDVPNYTHQWHWRMSHAALRRMGVIKNGRVTWKRPNWRYANRALFDRGNLLG